MPAPILFIPVAIPGAGKSTLAKGLEPVTIESTDYVRTKLRKEPASVDPEIFETYHRWIGMALENRESVYADATNLRAFARLDLSKIASRHGAKTHLILFRNVSQAIARNAQRTGTEPGTMPVPPDAMLKMIEQYERALVDIASEHYDFVTEVSRVG